MSQFASCSVLRGGFLYDIDDFLAFRTLDLVILAAAGAVLVHLSCPVCPLIRIQQPIMATRTVYLVDYLITSVSFENMCYKDLTGL